MSTFRTKLVRPDGTLEEDNPSMTRAEVLKGFKRLLKRDSLDELYIFRCHPNAVPDSLSAHLHITKED